MDTFSERNQLIVMFGPTFTEWKSNETRIFYPSIYRSKLWIELCLTREMTDGSPSCWCGLSQADFHDQTSRIKTELSCIEAMTLARHHTVRLFIKFTPGFSPACGFQFALTGTLLRTFLLWRNWHPEPPDFLYSSLNILQGCLRRLHWGDVMK